jgi:translocation and assembly module TamB
MALGFVLVLLTMASPAVLRTEWASVRLLGWIPGLQVVEPHGALWGDFRATRVTLSLPRGGRLELMQPAWQGLAFHHAPQAPWQLGVRVTRLQAAELRLSWVPDPKASPAQGPAEINLPVSLQVDDLRLERVSTPWQQGVPAMGLQGRLALQQPAHTVRVDALRWNGWGLSGEARLAAQGRAPQQLAAQLKAQGPRGQGELVVRGALADLALSVTASVRPGPQAPSQRLMADARLAPFEAWPVLQARVQAQHFDLQPWVPGGPFTALTGQATLVPRDALPGAPGSRAQGDDPAHRVPATANSAGLMRRGSRAPDLLLDVTLRNDKAAPWDAAALPIRQLSGQATVLAAVSGTEGHALGERGQLALRLTLPGREGRRDGEVKVSGPWDLRRADRTRLAVALHQLDLQALHTQAPPVMWQGQAQGRGLPKPAEGEGGVWAVQADLEGRALTASGASAGARAATVGLQAVVSASRWVLEGLRLQAGDARADLQGQWTRQLNGAWDGEFSASFNRFDPASWMPWPRPPGDSVQRTALHGSLMGRARLEAAQGPKQGATLASSEAGSSWQSRLVAQCQAQLSDSLLLGVPTSAELQWRWAGEPGGWQGRVQAAAAGNVLTLSVQGPALVASMSGLSRAQWQLQAPRLDSLQAWAAATGWRELRGQIDSTGQWQGQVRTWQSQGRIQAQGVQALRGDARVGLTSAQGQWVLQDGAGAAPWQLSLQARDAQWGVWTVSDIASTLTGTRQSHQWSLQADVLTPERRLSNGARVREKARAEWALQGQWRAPSDGAAAGAGWSAQVSRLSVRPVPAAANGEWLVVDPFRLDTEWAPQGRRWRMGATRARVFGAQLVVAPSGGQGTAAGEGVDLQVALTPLPVAELLGRWQPDAGWGGDLLVGGQLSARRVPGGAWSVSGGLQRVSGDLSLREPGIDGASAQKLGLNEFKLMLHAQDGLWKLEPMLDGRVLGSIGGMLSLRAQRPDLLPGPDDALSGQMLFKVDNLRAASVWAPAGWRLGGKLSANLQVAGTLHKPDLQGLVAGEGVSVANPLLGVQVTHGEMLLRLGEHSARIERFEAQGGNGGGSLTASGTAEFGEVPTARVSLRTQRFALLQRVDRRAVVTGQVDAILQPDQLQAQGEFGVDEGLIDISQSEAPTIGDDVNVVNRPGVADEPVQAGTSRKMAVQITLNLGERLRLKGRGLDTHLGGQMRLTTPGNRPQIHGRVTALDGTYAAYGQKLLIERGGITFTGPVENPRLDILAMRPQSPTASASDVKVGVQISGTAQEPRVRLYSEPTMSDTEKLSWLVLGRAPAGLGGADLGLLQTAAAALIDGEGPSRRDTLVSTLGLDDLSVRQNDGAVRDTIVSVGKQVSRNWYLGYERSLNATTGTWQAIYRLAQRFTLRAQAGDDNAVDLIWSRRWD